VLVHALLILGVGFAVKGDAPLVPTLEVIFSQTRTALTPKQADFLAAANQEGGGEHDRAQRPRDNQAGIVPQAQADSARFRSSSNRPRRFRRRRRGWSAAAMAKRRWRRRRPARRRSSPNRMRR
jgi:hypothetical protein